LIGIELIKYTVTLAPKLALFGLCEKLKSPKHPTGTYSLLEELTSKI
jgi:hypothetical protein